MENMALVISLVDTGVILTGMLFGMVIGAAMMWFTIDLKRYMEVTDGVRSNRAENEGARQG